MTAIIETRELCKRFGSFTAVKPLNLEISQGEIYGFLGANGAGKTTAIRMLCGLVKPSSGGGKVAHADIVKESVLLRSRIGYMAQKFSLYPDLSLRQNLGFYGGLYGLRGSKLQNAMEMIAQRLGLNPLLDRLTADIPWGWQQRLALAVTTMHQPQVLFLDEPTGSVDPLYRRYFWDLIRDFVQDGMTVFVTTHFLDEAEYCHRVSLMDRGGVIAQGSPRELKDQYEVGDLHQVFLKAIGVAR